jgi:hypothetical protein
MPDVKLWIPQAIPRKQVTDVIIDKVQEAVARHLECDGLKLAPGAI